MRLAWQLSDYAAEVIEILQLEGETEEDCADRLLGNLLQISMDQDNYEQHFGPQKRQRLRVMCLPKPQ